MHATSSALRIGFLCMVYGRRNSAPLSVAAESRRLNDRRPARRLGSEHPIGLHSAGANDAETCVHNLGLSVLRLHGLDRIAAELLQDWRGRALRRHQREPG